MKKIICSYGTTCFISGMEIDNKPALLIDLNIKSYKVLVRGELNKEGKIKGWQEFDFPLNTIVHDKIYLGAEHKEKISTLLDEFLFSGYLDNLPEHTPRGFGYVDLVDIYQNKISIQNSSNVDAAIWLGCDTQNKAWTIEQNKMVAYPFPQGDLLLNDRLHLKRKEAKQFKKAIDLEWQNAVILSEQKQIGLAIPEKEVANSPQKNKFII